MRLVQRCTCQSYTYKVQKRAGGRGSSLPSVVHPWFPLSSFFAVSPTLFPFSTEYKVQSRSCHIFFPLVCLSFRGFFPQMRGFPFQQDPTITRNWPVAGCTNTNRYLSTIMAGLAGLLPSLIVTDCHQKQPKKRQRDKKVSVQSHMPVERRQSKGQRKRRETRQRERIGPLLHSRVVLNRWPAAINLVSSGWFLVGTPNECIPEEGHDVKITTCLL